MGQFNTTISLKSSTKRISPLSEISYGCLPINSLKLSADGHQTSRGRQPFSENHSAQVSYIETSSNRGELCIPAIHLQGGMFACTICHEDCKGIEQGFWNRWSVPQILRPTDGKHISIICRRWGRSKYFNYKGFYFLVSMLRRVVQNVFRIFASRFWVVQLTMQHPTRWHGFEPGQCVPCLKSKMCVGISRGFLVYLLVTLGDLFHFIVFLKHRWLIVFGRFGHPEKGLKKAECWLLGTGVIYCFASWRSLQLVLVSSMRSW